MRDLLRRLRQWDHLVEAGDGPYWQREIDAILGGAQRPEDSVWAELAAIRADLARVTEERDELRAQVLEANVERDQARHVVTYWQDKAMQVADQRDALRAGADAIEAWKRAMGVIGKEHKRQAEEIAALREALERIARGDRPNINETAWNLRGPARGGVAEQIIAMYALARLDAAPTEAQ